MAQNEIQTKYNTYNEKMKQLKKQIKQLSIPCNHQYDSGKSAIKPVGENQCKCKLCNEVFGLAPVQFDQLCAATNTLHDAINQIKICCKNTGEDRALVENLGKQDFYNLDLLEVYSRITSEYGSGKKKKKKKKGNKSSVGYYGNLNF